MGNMTAKVYSESHIMFHYLHGRRDINVVFKSKRKRRVSDVT